MKPIINVILTLLLCLQLMACATSSPYKITNVGDEFSDPKAPAGKMLEGNYIDFVDPMKLVPFSELNPYVFRNKTTSEVVECGFRLINVRSNGKWLL